MGLLSRLAEEAKNRTPPPPKESKYQADLAEARGRTDAARSGLDPAFIRQYVCPHCKSQSGSPCVRPSEHTVFGGGFHKQRIEAARAAKDLMQAEIAYSEKAKADGTYLSPLDRDEATFDHGRRLAIWLRVACPKGDCRATVGQPCTFKWIGNGSATHNRATGAVHKVRKNAFWANIGQPTDHPDEKGKRPKIYYNFPDADDYDSWVVLKANNHGTYGPTPVKSVYGKKAARFSSWKEAQKEETRQKQVKKVRGCLGVFPGWQDENGRWTHIGY